MSKTRVMIVDDSAVVRQVVAEVLRSDPTLEVVGTARDPVLALEQMQRMEGGGPDVFVLDVEMPRMDGITFLRQLMQTRPTPVVICSTLTEQSAQVSLDALAAGAVAIVTKPKLGLRQFLDDASDDLISAVKAAARARVRKIAAAPKPAEGKLTADAILPPARQHALVRTTERLAAIGTSTGGTQALEEILTSLPVDAPGIVVVQHMPPGYTAAFAARLDRACEIEVREAKTGDRVLPGRALIAPGGQHMLLRRSGAQYFVDIVAGPPVSRHRPSVDVLFRSAARAAGANAIGVIMTGMGDDGAAGLLEMRKAGAQTLAQDEESSVVFGMAKEAIRRGAVERTVPLSRIAAEILLRATDSGRAA